MNVILLTIGYFVANCWTILKGVFTNQRVVKLYRLPPNLKVPEDGMKAYEEGFGCQENPFRPHTPDYSIWRDDWLFSAGRRR